MARRTQAPKYTPERAACILAEAELFGDVQTCSKWLINRNTLRNYRIRLDSDQELKQLLILKRRMLAIGWQDQACRTLNVALNELARRMPIAQSDDDTKIIACIANACKIVGELKVTGEVMNSPQPQTPNPAYITPPALAKIPSLS